MQLGIEVLITQLHRHLEKKLNKNGTNKVSEEQTWFCCLHHFQFVVVRLKLFHAFPHLHFLLVAEIWGK